MFCAYQEFITSFKVIYPWVHGPTDDHMVVLAQHLGDLMLLSGCIETIQIIGHYTWRMRGYDINV